MFYRFRMIFHRYAHQHLSLERSGTTITDQNNRSAATLERITLTGGSLLVTGWSDAALIRLSGAHGSSATVPDMPRYDLDTADDGAALRVGFQLRQALGDGHFALQVVRDPADVARTISYRFTPFPRWQLRWAKLRLLPGFVGRLMALGPDLLRWRFGRNAAAKAAIKDALGLRTSPRAQPLVPSVLPDRDGAQPTSKTVSNAPEIAVILPVYNAFEVLQLCLERVEQHTDLPWTLIVVEDGSSDARVRPWLRTWSQARPDRVCLLENAQNLGFIGAVNRGLEEARRLERHCVLLNSDALVPAGWASRLVAPLERDADVASVTPLSNDAEIVSVPCICQRTDLMPGQADRLDALAQTLRLDALAVDMPTGVGFCMALHKDWLAKLPHLDTAFGRGYGEEVDWCQKIRALGGRHVAAPNLFVEHRGGESFGSEAKHRLVAKNNAIVSQRYPRYDQEVQTYITTDPLATPRLVLAMAWAKEVASDLGEALPVYLGHTLGGGAEHYLERRIDSGLKTGGLPAIVLRVGGAARWQIEVVSPGGRVNGFTDDVALMTRLFTGIGPARLIYSCGVGDSDPVSLPRHLEALADVMGPETRLEVLVHDYFMVSPSYTLLDHQGDYHGPVRAGDALADDPAHQDRRPDKTLVSLSDWQAAWGALLQRAERIVVFSQSSRAIIAEIYPSTAARIDVIPHRLPHSISPVAPRPTGQGPRVVAILGNIGFQKGAGLLAGLAQALAKDDIRLVVLGSVDPAFPPPRSVHVHGPYAPSEITGLATRYGITDWLIPSIWPETFCFTVHEALATGLPTYAFDIGAQGEAVRHASNGIALPWEGSRSAAEVIARALHQTASTVSEPLPSIEAAPHER